MYTHSKEFRDTLTPDLALKLLKEGNDRFVKNLVTWLIWISSFKC